MNHVLMFWCCHLHSLCHFISSIVCLYFVFRIIVYALKMSGVAKSVYSRIPLIRPPSGLKQRNLTVRWPRGLSMIVTLIRRVGQLLSIKNDHKWPLYDLLKPVLKYSQKCTKESDKLVYNRGSLFVSFKLYLFQEYTIQTLKSVGFCSNFIPALRDFSLEGCYCSLFYFVPNLTVIAFNMLKCLVEHKICICCARFFCY